MNNLVLVYVKYYASNPDGSYVYEFYYSNEPDSVWGLDWECPNPSICEDLTPDPLMCQKIEKMTLKYKMTTIQETSCYSMEYAIDGSVALAWINIEGMDEYPEEGRMTLHFGDSESKVLEIIRQ